MSKINCCKIFEHTISDGMTDDYQESINEWLSESNEDDLGEVKIISHTQIISNIGSIITTIFYTRTI